MRFPMFSRRSKNSLFQWYLCYEGKEDEGEGSGEGGEGEGGAAGAGGSGKPAGRFMTQEEIDSIVTKRTEKARNSNKQTLKQLEQMQETMRLTDEQKEALEVEIEKLRKQTL